MPSFITMKEGTEGRRGGGMWDRSRILGRLLQ